jgi:SAM-dependent methyltransferase
MCGTGRFLIPLLEKEYEVVGFDNSSHMLEVCKAKCKEKQLSAELMHASFENFKSEGNFQLIFIPSGSFCLLVDPIKASLALKVIFDSLAMGGKFIFEVETLKAINDQQGIWQTRWLDKPDGSLLVGSFTSRFDAKSRIETTLCRYELWQNNSIVQMEVEDFRLKLYELNELEDLLKKSGFQIEERYIPYTTQKADEKAPEILYECRKVRN